MSSDLIPVLRLLQINNYGTIVLLTAVGYNYILTLAREINYIWSRPWSWVSTLFVLVRYVGLCWVINIGLAGSTFVPGPVKACASNVYKERFNADVRTDTYSKGTGTFLASDLAFCIFFAAAELMMILRVYALWNRSKRVLAVLVFIFLVEVIIDFVIMGVFDNTDTYFSVTVVQVLDLSFCNYSNKATINFKLYYAIPRYVLAAALLILALIKTLSQSVAMYKATKQWQPNKYLKLFAGDSVLYFFMNMLLNILGAVVTDPTLNTVSVIFIAVLADVSLCNIMPHFIISVREMYDRDSRLQGIDTGFGVAPYSNVGRDAGMSSIGFADVTSSQSPAEGNVGGIALERIESIA